jgi:hypothetical protein
MFFLGLVLIPYSVVSQIFFNYKTARDRVSFFNERASAPLLFSVETRYPLAASDMLDMCVVGSCG